MNNKEPCEDPVEPNPFWRKNAEKLVSDSIYSIEEVAKQLILVTSLLEGIYFHAITSSDIKALLHGKIAFLYLMPIVLWLLSLIFALLTLFPNKYHININSSHDSREIFEKILFKDYKLLITSEIFLIVSFIALFFTMWHYLLVVPNV